MILVAFKWNCTPVRANFLRYAIKAISIPTNDSHESQNITIRMLFVRKILFNYVCIAFRLGLNECSVAELNAAQQIQFIEKSRYFGKRTK